MLESLVVYSLSLANVPKGILGKVWKKLFRFLWARKRIKDETPLVRWTKLSFPKHSRMVGTETP